MSNKAENIKKIIQLSNLVENTVELVTTMTGVLPPEAAEVLLPIIQDVCRSDEALNGMVEIFSKHLSEEEVDGTLAFYESKAGRGYMSKQPTFKVEMQELYQKIFQESFSVLQKKYH